ncbi:DUF1062 domain-containing protein [Salmonella enterica]|nr:DUF1062 domain-containing protein [Salmonella enterica]EHM5264043.1 DUF1062 domain-containing protein [Salmonella enterica]
MKVTWTVTPVGYQRIARRCPSCNVKREFAPSGAFRVNSQKKVLDVWSIYKCTQCEYTWNIALFSRLQVSKMAPELYNRFITNDVSTVEYFSHDKATLKRSKAEPAGEPEFCVQEQWQASVHCCQWVTVSISFSRPFQINMQSVLKRQLLLSAAEIKKLVDEGHIRGITMKKLKSRTLKTGNIDFQLSSVTLYARRRVVLIRY